MLVDETHPRRDSSDFCGIEIEIIGKVKDAVRQSINTFDEVEHPSRILKSRLAAELFEVGWKKNFEIDSKISNEYPSAIFTIDYFLDIKDADCSHKHRFFLEISFDNRQNLGTNLLKFEVASMNSHKFEFKTLPLLICADEAILKKYNWDGAIADIWEYDHAIRIPYADVLREIPVLISIRDSK